MQYIKTVLGNPHLSSVYDVLCALNAFNSVDMGPAIADFQMRLLGQWRLVALATEMQPATETGHAFYMQFKSALTIGDLVMAFRKLRPSTQEQPERMPIKELYDCTLILETFEGKLVAILRQKNEGRDPGRGSRQA